MALKDTWKFAIIVTQMHHSDIMYNGNLHFVVKMTEYLNFDVIIFIQFTTIRCSYHLVTGS